MSSPIAKNSGFRLVSPVKTHRFISINVSQCCEHIAPFHNLPTCHAPAERGKCETQGEAVEIQIQELFATYIWIRGVLGTECESSKSKDVAFKGVAVLDWSQIPQKL